MTSSRLPGKVLMDLEGAPMLVQQLRRLQRASSLSDIVVATTTNSTDDDLAAAAEQEGVHVFRGGETDVLRRYADAARVAQADVVVRLTADCPLSDPDVVDRVVQALTPVVDYASNVIERTFPVGLDVEALQREVLDRLDRLGASRAAREHVTWFLLNEQPQLFTVASVTDDVDNSDLRWTVDRAEDLELVRRLYADLRLAERPLPYGDVIAYVREHSELATANVPVAP
jgi:spore coat polysaccharide biosynthesis protein SpsF